MKWDHIADLLGYLTIIVIGYTLSALIVGWIYWAGYGWIFP